MLFCERLIQTETMCCSRGPVQRTCTQSFYPGCLPSDTQSSVLDHRMIYLKPCYEQRPSCGVSLQFFFISFVWSYKIMVSCFILGLWERSHEVSLCNFSVHWLTCVIQFSSAMCSQNSSSCLPPDTTIHSRLCNFEIWFLSTFYPKFTFFIPPDFDHFLVSRGSTSISHSGFVNLSLQIIPFHWV